MRQLKTLVLTLGLATMLSGAGSQALAHGGEEGAKHLHPLQRMLSKLELSGEQQTEIETLISTFQENYPRPDRQVMKERRVQMHEQRLALLSAAAFDETGMRELLAQGQQQRIEHMVAKMRLHHAVYQQLTPEQQEAFMEMMSHMGRYGKGRYHRMQGH